MGPLPGDGYVQALARGLDVVTAFDADHASMTLSEVAARAGLSRATARRLLLTLVELGYVRQDARVFTLTPQVLRLGAAYLAGMDLPEVAQPHLEQLSRRVGESCSVAVLDGSEIVYVARAAVPRRLVRVTIAVGTRFPAHATSMGRVLLAALPPEELEARLGHPVALTDHTETDPGRLHLILDAVRRDAHALVDQELEVGLRSLAVPVGPGAAVNLSMSTADPSGAADPLRHLAALRDTAAAIADDLALTRVS